MAEKEPHELSRRNAVKAMISGVVAPVVGLDIVLPVVETEVAKNTMLARLGLTKGRLDVNFFSDHIPHDIDPGAIVMGEFTIIDLLITQEQVDGWNGEQRKLFNGTETLGKQRMQELYNSVRRPILSIATDGSFPMPTAYLAASSGGVLTKRILQSIISSGSLGTSYIMALTTSPSDRRTFLKTLGLGTLLRVGAKIANNQIDSRIDFTDLSGFSPIEQQIFREISQNHIDAIRNKVMTANMNALATVPLSLVSSEGIIFAGNAHRAMIEEFLRLPENVASDLRQFLLGNTENLGMIYKFLDIFKTASTIDEQALIASYMINGLASLFAPVKIRFNWQKNDSLTAFADMSSTLKTASRDVATTESAFVILSRALAEVYEKTKNDEAAQRFFGIITQLMYGPQALLKFTTAIISLPNEVALVDLPVSFRPSDEIIDIAGHRVWINRGFVTKSE